MTHLRKPHLHFFRINVFRFVGIDRLPDTLRTIHWVITSIYHRIRDASLGPVTGQRIARNVCGYGTGKNVSHFDVVDLIDFRTQRIHVADQSELSCRIRSSQRRTNASRH